MTRPATRSLRVGARHIAADAPCLVVAEIGINHGGSIDVARQLVDAAAAAGADAVKFQKRALEATYRADVLSDSRLGEQGVQYLLPILATAELGEDDYRALKAHAAACGLAFLCTPWDLPSVDVLERVGVDAYKVGSPDLTNAPLIDRVARTGRPVILSTGMSTEEEIRRALAQLETIGADFAVMHCVSTYPSRPDEVNLRFLETLAGWTDRPIGYSGHEPGIHVSCAAVALGARILERHITLDRTAPGPDHRASLEPAEFATLVAAVREVESALGSAARWMSRGEMLNRRVLGKSVVASRDIPAGVPVEPEMLVARSPGLGVSPQDIPRFVGRRLRRAVASGEPLHLSDLADAGRTSDPVAINVGAPWGIVVRSSDVGPLLDRFGALGLAFLEFHVTDRDLDAGVAALPRDRFDVGLVVHGPEYRGDALVDLCAPDAAARQSSREAVQRVIDLAREMGRRFTLDPALFPLGPKVIVHAGGMHPHRDGYDPRAAMARLADSVGALDATGVELLLENLPPLPWYFGGRWHGHVMCDAESVEAACRATGLGLCLDTSHAALACTVADASLAEFADRVRPLVRHLHVSDAAGTSGEGMQVGDGAINFVDLLPRVLGPTITLVPEVWMGHHELGEGFFVALGHLADIHWAKAVVARDAQAVPPGDLAALVVPEDATVFAALRVIDANRMGIAFVVDGGRRVVGVVTDGDVRHAFVRGLGLHSGVRDVMTRDFIHGREGMTREEIRARLPGRTRVMPIIDAEGRLVDVANLWTVGGAAS